MTILHQIDALHAFAGMFVGFLVGMTGVGGGALMTPVLVLLFGVSPQTAVGTDLLYAAITKITGSAVHGWRDTVDWPIVRRLALGSVPAAILTITLLSMIGKPSPNTEHVTLFALACLLAVTSLTVIFRGWLVKLTADLDPLRPPAKAAIGTVALGAVIGIAVSVTSVGAGAIGVTVLLVLYPRLPIVRIVGSDIAHAVPLALVAGFGHWLIGDVDGVLLTNLLIGSIPGVVIGSLLSTRASDKLLRPLLATVLAVSSWQLFEKVNAAPAHTAAPVKPAPRGTISPALNGSGRKQIGEV